VLLALVVVAAFVVACTDEYAALLMGHTIGLLVGLCSSGVCFVQQVCGPGYAGRPRMAKKDSMELTC
jgi:hypothetical protein